jgi:hypothetical protein
VSTRGWFGRKRGPGPAERERRKQVNEAWRAERRQAGEEWARELERRRLASVAAPESTREEAGPTTSLWAELERLRRREDVSQSQ